MRPHLQLAAAAGLLAAAVLLHVAAVRRFRVPGAAEFWALVALLLVALACVAAPRALLAALGGGRSAEGFAAAGDPAAAPGDADADAAAYDPPTVDVLDALSERVLPSVDKLVASFRKASALEGDSDPELMEILVSKEAAGGEDNLRAYKRADFFLCKTAAFSPQGHARLVQALAAAAGGYKAEDEPPMPPPEPRTDGEPDDEGEGQQQGEREREGEGEGDG